MSRCYWLSILTAFGLAVAAYAADASPISNDVRGQADTKQGQAKPEADHTPIILDAVERGINRITGALETLKPEPKNAREEQRAERDLDAQEGMVYWAKCVFWVAVGTLILTAIGVLLLTGTLVYTKQAAKFAGKAADAAIDAAKHGQTAAIATVEAAKAAAINIETLYKIERAYISGGGSSCLISYSAGHIIIRGVESTAASTPPTHFRVDINNYGKTPGEFIEVHVGLLDGTIPETVPAPSKRLYFYDWIKSDTASRPLPELVEIPSTFKNPIVFGRVYYRDIILKKLHSSGFILNISKLGGGQPIPAYPEYTEERDENGSDPPELESA